MRTFVLGDIHGAYKALINIFKQVNFDNKKDKLICLGDVADGWSEVVECFNRLMKVKNLIYIMGNHDKLLFDWLQWGTAEYIWLSQGGQATVNSFNKHHINGDSANPYIKFFKKARYYYVDEENRAFVHGGFNPSYLVEYTDKSILTWDRDLWGEAINTTGIQGSKFTQYDEVFLGHTTTQLWGKLKPMNKFEIWNLDTGAGWSGKLTIMDVNTKEYFQSDFVKNYYPEEKGRF